MFGKYMLIDIKDNKPIKEIEANCYGDALVAALKEMGFKVEVIEAASLEEGDKNVEENKGLV
jgi:hypothetical protein